MNHTVKKWIIKGTVSNLSPLVIGTGEREADTDIIIQKDDKGNPFIPATSFAGACRHYFFESLNLEDQKDALEQLWGTSQQVENEAGEKEHRSIKSKIFFSDLILCKDANPIIEIRDGIRIDPFTGLVENSGKYDYEMLSKGATFNLKIEIQQTSEFSDELIQRFVLTLKQLLESGDFSLGSMNTNGYGKIKMNQTQIHQYDLSNKSHVLQWLKGEVNDHTNFDATNFKPFESDNRRNLNITLFLQLKTPLHIRSYSTSPQAPDSSYIKSNNQAVIPGSSIKGALRGRGDKIIRTFLKEEKALSLSKNLFGWVSTTDEEEKIKSRFTVRETYMNLNEVVETIQARIKIDRFTGGTIKTALFDEMPLWPSKSDECIRIDYSIKNCEDWEAGLALLIMKDMMVSDLPVGGGKSIGRGLFTGEKAKIVYKGDTFVIEQGETIKIQGEKEKLEGYVNHFNDQMTRENEGVETV